jgi:protein SCO1
MKASHVILLMIAILTGIVSVAGTMFLSRPYSFNGVTLDPKVGIKDFTLTDQNGKPFNLGNQRDKIILIFFGYTHCPDICPVTLSDYGSIRAKLGDKANKVQFVFITVDPERDTAARLKNYLEIFDPNIIGLTGERNELKSVWDSFFVYQEKVEVGSASGYLVDHTSRIYMVDEKGNLFLTFHFGTTSEEMAADIIHLLGRN